MMVTGNITRTLKLRLKETETRNPNHSKHGASEFSPQDSKNGLSFGLFRPISRSGRTARRLRCPLTQHSHQSDHRHHRRDLRSDAHPPSKLAFGVNPSVETLQ